MGKSVDQLVVGIGKLCIIPLVLLLPGVVWFHFRLERDEDEGYVLETSHVWLMGLACVMTSLAWLLFVMLGLEWLLGGSK